ncbi:MAG: phosphohydrolase [Burkholderiales bacterium]|nr:phosphohydrolase [Burkholderiales bacterium]
MSAPARVPLTEVADLMSPGQPLPFRVHDSLGRLLLAQGQRIHDVRQLQALLERGACVEYEEVQEVRSKRAAAAAVGGGRVPSTRELTWFDRFDQQVWALDSLLRALVKGDLRSEVEGGGLAAQIGAFGDAFIELVERHPDAALFHAVRQDDKRYALYALTHALHAATVTLLAARQIGWPAPQVRGAALATLTMNAAIVDLQGRMAEQKEPPSKAQLDQIRAHPHRSAELLAAAGVADEAWLQAVRDHHERTQGGYPKGGAEPGEVARLVRAADVYTAKISPRALRMPQTPQAAARQLFQEEGGGPLAAALIKTVGVYPPGDLVTLKNGETAVVVMRTAAGNAPQVAVLLSAQGKPVPGAPRRDTGQADTAIAGPLADRSKVGRVLPEAVYGLLK